MCGWKHTLVSVVGIVALLGVLVVEAPRLSSAGAAASIDVYGPKPFHQILDSPKTTVWTPAPAASIANRQHVVLLDAATQSFALSLDSPSAHGLTVTSVADIASGAATFGDSLGVMFQMLDKNAEVLATETLTGTYTLQPELLSYFSVDADAPAGVATATDVTLRDKGSFYVEGQSIIAYLVFTFAGTPTSTTIQATSRYKYESGAFVLDTSWDSDQWLVMDSTSVSLTTTQGDATAFLLAEGTDLVDISLDAGSAFNPAGTAYQTNSFAPFPGTPHDYFQSRLYVELLNDVNSYYHDQFGATAAAATAAAAALDEIEAALSAEGSAMRYDKSVYLAYRDNALSHLFGADDVYNGVVGERTVAHVYFTNAQDDAGVYHPFMVVASHSSSGGVNSLIDVARPPGDGTPGLTYEQQTITRRAMLGNFLVKIPIKDYGLVDDFADNDLAALGLTTLAVDAGQAEADWNVLTHVPPASVGVAVDGVMIYPAANNTLAFATSVAEITSTGIHVGRGLGLHLHADGHAYNGNGINLYNLADYPGRLHPPLIGFGHDGVALFGTYESAHSSMDGAAIALDEFGGHDHGDYGYHYHAFSETVTDDAGPGPAVGPYTQHYLMVGAAKGNVNSIPGFYELVDNQLKDDAIKRYAGGTAPTTTTPTSTPTPVPSSTPGPTTAMCNSLPVTINMQTNGGKGLGTAGDDVILGTTGDDKIWGLGGNDTICALAGRDSVNGGTGDDTIFGGSEIDRLRGAEGADMIYGEGGSDRIFAGPGADMVWAGSGADRVFGGPDDDVLNGMGGQDSMWGEGGNDLLQGNWQSDWLYGGDGDDDLRGAGGKDKIFGEAGDDIMAGGNNTDFLDGGDGNDSANGQKGKDNPLVTNVSGCIAEMQTSC